MARHAHEQLAQLRLIGVPASLDCVEESLVAINDALERLDSRSDCLGDLVARIAFKQRGGDGLAPLIGQFHLVPGDRSQRRSWRGVGLVERIGKADLLSLV